MSLQVLRQQHCQKQNDKSFDELAGDEGKIDELIKLLVNQSSTPQAKKKCNGQASRHQHLFTSASKQNARLCQRFKRLVRTTRIPECVVLAFGTLARMKDHVAQEKLQEELQSEKPESDRLIPLHQAIAMLGFDSKALDNGVLRKIVKASKTKDDLVAAIRHLPADTESFQVLQSILEDEASPIEARSLVPEKINNVDPRKFLETVNKLLNEKGASEELAPALARGVGGIKTIEAERSTQEGSAGSLSMAPGLEAEIQQTKQLFKQLMVESPDALSAAAKEYLFWDEKDDE